MGKRVFVGDVFASFAIDGSNGRPNDLFDSHHWNAMALGGL
jgi:hypothetical protein